MKDSPTKRVSQNKWGNWIGYISGKPVEEFAFDTGFLVASDTVVGDASYLMPQAAKEWLLKPAPKTVRFSRVWAMPNSDTFSVNPIGNFVKRYLGQSQVSVDPFSRNSNLATYTNDLNPKTSAQYHMDAEVFIEMLASKGVKCDLAIFDPPYSPRQISECYKEAGITVGMKETQNSKLYARIKTSLLAILTQDATVLSFGWNSAGMGIKHGFEQVEIMLVCHGAAHNDTICIAEKRNQLQLL